MPSVISEKFRKLITTIEEQNTFIEALQRKSKEYESGYQTLLSKLAQAVVAYNRGITEVETKALPEVSSGDFLKKSTQENSNALVAALDVILDNTGHLRNELNAVIEEVNSHDVDRSIQTFQALRLGAKQGASTNTLLGLPAGSASQPRPKTPEVPLAAAPTASSTLPDILTPPASVSGKTKDKKDKKPAKETVASPTTTLGALGLGGKAKTSTSTPKKTSGDRS